MLQYWIPAKLADPTKVFLRYLEKQGESPSDYVSDQKMPEIMSAWGDRNISVPTPAEASASFGAQGQGFGQQSGNLVQSNIGTQFGGQNAGPLPLG